MAGYQDFPVVHIDSLSGYAIDKQKKLGILSVIPLINICHNVHPHSLPVQLLGYFVYGLEPIMAVRVTTLKRIKIEKESIIVLW